jgi:hypothetical protein
MMSEESNNPAQSSSPEAKSTGTNKSEMGDREPNADRGLPSESAKDAKPQKPDEAKEKQSRSAKKGPNPDRGG